MKKYTKMEQGIFNNFVKNGIAGKDWRIKIVDKTKIGHSDHAKVLVDVFKPRKRKPIFSWELYINFVREQINWEKSIYYGNP